MGCGGGQVRSQDNCATRLVSTVLNYYDIHNILNVCVLLKMFRQSFSNFKGLALTNQIKSAVFYIRQLIWQSFSCFLLGMSLWFWHHVWRSRVTSRVCQKVIARWGMSNTKKKVNQSPFLSILNNHTFRPIQFKQARGIGDP